jgi:hypothetical protein
LGRCASIHSHSASVKSLGYRFTVSMMQPAKLVKSLTFQTRSKASLVRGDPLLDGKRFILRTHRSLFGQLGNTDLRPFWLRSLGRQLRDAPSDRRRSSFAFPGLRRFHMFSCHSTPGRRGHIRSITDRPWLFRPSQGCLRCPALRLGWPRPAWPGDTAFPCSAYATGWI